MQEYTDQQPQGWRRSLWLGVLVAASIVFTLGFACALPIAAFCAIAACTLPRRDAYLLTGAVWLANQAVGFAFLDYPWTAICLIWGAALGLMALLTTLAARQAIAPLSPMHAVGRHVVAFLAAFVASEAILICFSVVLGGLENYKLTTQLRILGINADGWIGLFALNLAGAAVGIAPSPTRAVHGAVLSEPSA